MILPAVTEGLVYIADTLVARLSRAVGVYYLTYVPEYLKNPIHGPLASSFPLQVEPFSSAVLFPYLENLAPEGALATAAAEYFRIPESDRFLALLSMGRDLSGRLRIESSNFPPLQPLDLPPAPLEVPFKTSRCLGTYEDIKNGHYSPEVCEAFQIEPNHYLPIRQNQLYKMLQASAQHHLSLAGFQPKISGGVVLRADLSQAAYLHSAIIKLPNPEYPKRAVLANEHLTTLMAKAFGIAANDSILMPMADGQLALVIRRFDRGPNNLRFECEDFCQIFNVPSHEKYNVAIESLGGLLREHSASPTEDKQQLFDQILFAIYTGNTDAHLKNFSLLTKGGRKELAPAYDLVATKMVMRDPDDIALSVSGIKTNLGPSHIWRIADSLEQEPKYVVARGEELAKRTPEFAQLIERSHLTTQIKKQYQQFLEKNVRRYHLATLGSVEPKQKTYESRYDDGTLESSEPHRGSELHGTVKTFYRDGRPKESTQYRYGYRHGKSTTWSPEGEENLREYSYGLPVVTSTP